jgi:hypothetical protein
MLQVAGVKVNLLIRKFMLLGWNLRNSSLFMTAPPEEPPAELPPPPEEREMPTR